MGTALFLRHIAEIQISVRLEKRMYTIRREDTSDGILTTVDNNADVSRQWLVISDNGVAIASPMLEEGQTDEDVFHCFLPTMDSTGLGIRVNGDFSTDPSRKHIVMDGRTESELQKISELIARQIVKDVNEKVNSQLLKGFAHHSPINIFSAKLDLLIKKKLQEWSWIQTTNGNKKPSECTLLEESICRASIIEELKDLPIYVDKNWVETNDMQVRKILTKIGVRGVKASEFVPIFENKEIVCRLSYNANLTLLLSIIRNMQVQRNRDSLISASEEWYLNYHSSLMRLPDAVMTTSLPNDLLSMAGKDDTLSVNWFLENKGYVINTRGAENEQSLSSEKRTMRYIPLWKSAEETCVEIEHSLGNTAKDVSRQNLGYDVISKTSDGKIRYIEVKSVKSIGDEIVLTNNEYTSAHQYGKDYAICLIAQNEFAVQALYVYDPLNNSRMEKRVKVWEWVMDCYKGHRIILEKGEK